MAKLYKGDANGKAQLVPLIGLKGEPGPQGSQGETGPQGPTGQGVPAGGTINQMLIKNSSNDFDTRWENVPQGLPGGGAPGNILFKTENYAEWKAIKSDTVLYDGEYITLHTNNLGLFWIEIKKALTVELSVNSTTSLIPNIKSYYGTFEETITGYDFPIYLNQKIIKNQLIDVSHDHISQIDFQIVVNKFRVSQLTLGIDGHRGDPLPMFEPLLVWVEK